jgi:preprotein translocase subunit YajC
MTMESTLNFVNDVASLLAQAPAVQPAPGWLQFLASFGPIILLLVLFWFIVIGGKRKQERERKTMLDSLAKGSTIRMVGGEIGSIVDMTETRVRIKVDESSNTKIWYVKEAIAGVMKDEK